MNLRLQFGILLLLHSFLWSCNSLGTKENAWIKAPEVEYAQRVIDSCNHYIPLFQLKQDSLSKVDEFETLKAKNNLTMLIQNLEDLMQQLGVDPKSLTTTEAQESHLLTLNTQAQYVQALLASGKAIYEEHSQSFGKWKK